MCDKANGRRHHQHAEIPERTDRRHRQTDGHDVLFAEQCIENRHDIGAADTDEEKTDIQKNLHVHRDDEHESQKGQHTAAKHDSLLAYFCVSQPPQRRIVSMAAFCICASVIRKSPF
ncbi:hypothetical protein [Mitsuokella sp.]